jgi:hypothetical protein
MIIDHVPAGGRYPPLLEVEVDIDANGRVHVVARVLGTDLERSCRAGTSTRRELPAALPIALPEPVAARQILIDGPELYGLMSWVKEIQRQEPNVLIQVEDRYRNKTLRSIVDAVTAKVSRALRDAKWNNHRHDHRATSYARIDAPRPDIQHSDATAYTSASRGWSAARAGSMSSSAHPFGS